MIATHIAYMYFEYGYSLKDNNWRATIHKAITLSTYQGYSRFLHPSSLLPEKKARKTCHSSRLPTRVRWSSGIARFEALVCMKNDRTYRSVADAHRSEKRDNLASSKTPSARILNRSMIRHVDYWFFRVKKNETKGSWGEKSELACAANCKLLRQLRTRE